MRSERGSAALEDLRQEGRRLLAEILRDCRNSRLVTTFTGGFVDAPPQLGGPASHVARWTERVVATAEAERLSGVASLPELPTSKRTSLETESSYAARCLNARLAKLDEFLADG